MGITSYVGDGIKSIQRGTVTIDNMNSNSVTITAVNTSRCILSVTGTGIINSGGSVAATRSFQIVLSSSTQVTITSQMGTGTTVTGTAAWQVVEYY